MKSKSVDLDPREIAEVVRAALNSFGLQVHITGVVVGPAVVRVNLSKPQTIEKLSDKEVMASAISYAKARGLPLDKNLLAQIARSKVPRVRMRDVPVGKVMELHRDLAIRLGVHTVRIANDKDGLFVEVPKRVHDIISVEAVMASPQWAKARSEMALPLCLGVDIYGQIVVYDLALAPHALVAGTTGSGKSNTLHVIVHSLVTARGVDDLRIYLADLKGGVELSAWHSIPHLAREVATTPDDCVSFFAQIEREISTRYTSMKQKGMRSFADYRRETPSPYTVVIIDEIAALTIGHRITTHRALVTLSQVARSAGVHFVICTQRPSSDVIGASVTANYPLRIVHAVTSSFNSVNSRVAGVLGAETLLGRGDAFVLLPDQKDPIRVQVPYISTDTIHKKVEELHASVQKVR